MPEGMERQKGDTMEMNEKNIASEVRRFIAENFIIDGAEDLGTDVSLTETGVLDSMGVLELIAFLEEQFGISVPDEDALPENLDTVRRIVSYVARRKSSVTA